MECCQRGYYHMGTGYSVWDCRSIEWTLVMLALGTSCRKELSSGKIICWPTISWNTMRATLDKGCYSHTA